MTLRFTYCKLDLQNKLVTPWYWSQLESLISLDVCLGCYRSNKMRVCFHLQNDQNCFTFPLKWSPQLPYRSNTGFLFTSPNFIQNTSSLSHVFKDPFIQIIVSFLLLTLSRKMT